MQVWGITDVGLVRKDNQDAYIIRENIVYTYTVCAVCDGMGGTAGGQLASAIATCVYVQELEKILLPGMSPEQLREASSFAIALANRAIQAESQRSEGYADMGTTLVSAIVYAGGAVLSNVGDSRAYHITSTGIARITKDHSLVESMVDRGDITEAEARRHPKRNLITRALGTELNADCDGYICPLADGDYLLLCTDGLVNTVTDQEMLFEILHGGGVDTCLDRLLTISKSRGASDNVTAVLIRQ